MGWRPYDADCVAAHFSQRTREMGHPVCFLRHRIKWAGYTFRETLATRQGKHYAVL
jgi:hypothetical protein